MPPRKKGRRELEDQERREKSYAELKRGFGGNTTPRKAPRK